MSSPASPRPRRIVFITHHEERGRDLAARLESRGVAVRVLPYGTFVVRDAVEAAPDLTLIEVDRADWDGQRVARILGWSPHSPVVILAQELSPGLARQLGEMPRLVKIVALPLDWRDLVAEVEDALVRATRRLVPRDVATRHGE